MNKKGFSYFFPINKSQMSQEDIDKIQRENKVIIDMAKNSFTTISREEDVIKLDKAVEIFKNFINSHR